LFAKYTFKEKEGTTVTDEIGGLGTGTFGKQNLML